MLESPNQLQQEIDFTFAENQPEPHSQTQTKFQELPWDACQNCVDLHSKYDNFIQTLQKVPKRLLKQHDREKASYEQMIQQFKERE